MKEIDITIPSIYDSFLSTDARYRILTGGRGSAKSTTVAIYLLLIALQDKKRILCTREIQKSIKDSVHKLLSDLINKYELPYYEITRDSIVNKATGSEFLFYGLRHNIDEIKSTEGIDIAWVEEAQSISMESLDVLIPTIRKDGSYFIFTLNRKTENDAVYRKFLEVKRDNVYHLHTTYLNNEFCPQVLKEEAEFDKQNDYKKYMHIWLGLPVQQDDQAILDRAILVKAMKENKVEPIGSIEFGVDVARYGDDRSVIYKRKGLKVIDSKVLTKKNTVEVALEIMKMADKSDIIKVDETGVGAGVIDTLRDNGYNNVIGVNFGGKPKDKDKYVNVIAEMFFSFKGIYDKIQLEYDTELLLELTSRLYKVRPDGRIEIESKDAYKKRYGKSPDKGDALLLCFYQPKKVSRIVATIV